MVDKSKQSARAADASASSCPAAPAATAPRRVFPLSHRSGPPAAPCAPRPRNGGPSSCATSPPHRAPQGWPRQVARLQRPLQPIHRVRPENAQPYPYSLRPAQTSCPVRCVESLGVRQRAGANSRAHVTWQKGLKRARRAGQIATSGQRPRCGQMGLVCPALPRTPESIGCQNRRPNYVASGEPRQQGVHEPRTRIAAGTCEAWPARLRPPAGSRQAGRWGRRRDCCQGSRRSATSVRRRDRTCMSSTTLRTANLANCRSMTRPPGRVRQPTRRTRVLPCPRARNG